MAGDRVLPANRVGTRRRSLLRRGVPLAVGSLVLVGGSVGAWAATTGEGGNGFRTTTVGTADISQDLDLTGTVSAVRQADASFGVAGTAKTVDVAVGDTVTAGQELAALDTTDLARAVTKAQAALDIAEAARDASADSASTDSAVDPAASTATARTATTRTVPTSAPATTAPATTPATSTRPSSLDTSREQEAVRSAQAAVTAARAKATAALATQATACAAVLAAPTAPSSSEPTSSAAAAPVETPSAGTATETPITATLATPSPEAEPQSAVTQTAETSGSGTPSAAPTSAPDRTGPSSDLTRCIAALTAVQAAQQDVQVDQSALDAALGTFAKALTKATGTATTPTSPTTPSTPSTPSTPVPTTGTGSTGNENRGATPSASGGTPTGSATPTGGAGGRGGSSPEVVVLQAQAALFTAKADLASATVTAPISGTVAAVPYAVGGAVSSSDAITVVGTGAVRVTVDVPLATIPSVKVGQVATVTAAGATTPVAGTVESIGILPVSTTSATYPVVVLVPQAPAALVPGSAAAVSIVLATADDVVAVPSSALTTLGTRKAVRLVKDGKAVLTPVETGAAGSLFTQVTSGVAVGDELVLADLGADLPSSSGTLTNRPGGGFGGAGVRTFTGAGPAAGGARPGPP